MSWLVDYFGLEFWLGHFVRRFLTNWGSPLCSGACHWTCPKFARRPFRLFDIASSGPCNACERAAAEWCSQTFWGMQHQHCAWSEHRKAAEFLPRCTSPAWIRSLMFLGDNLGLYRKVNLQEIQGPVWLHDSRRFWWGKFIVPFAWGWNRPAVAALALLPKPLWSEETSKGCQTEEFQEFFDCCCCHISSLATCRVLESGESKCTTWMQKHILACVSHPCRQILREWLTLRNKPYLPIPSGRLSLTSAWIVVLSSLFLAEAVTMCFQNLDIGSIACLLLFFQVVVCRFLLRSS